MTHSNCLVIGRSEAERMKSGVVVVEGSGKLAGSRRMRENKFLPHRHGDESTAGRGRAEEAGGLWGTG